MEITTSVIGSGSWATALVRLLLNTNTPVNWFIAKKEDAEYIKSHHHNPRYLSSVSLEEKNLKIYSDLEKCISDSEHVVLAIPSAFCHATLSRLSSGIFKNKIVFSGIKGIIPEYKLIVGEYLNRVFEIPLDRIGVIGGPCHAEEVAMEKLSYLTLACQNILIAELFSESLRCRYIRVTCSDDIYGTEYSAVLKNVVAIAGGICHGLGYGDNFFAVLVSNAIQEIERFVEMVHPISRDIKSSVYLGDLLVTAYSQFSRNRMFGTMLGKGYSVKMAQLEMNMIAEGYYAVDCVHALNKEYKVTMPITEAVYNICYLQKAAATEMLALSQKLS